jgi:hypothetical protein
MVTLELTVDNLIIANDIAVETAVAKPGIINEVSGDLVLANTYGLLVRLGLEGYADIADESALAIEHAANAVRIVAPVPDLQNVEMRHEETEAQHDFRINFVLPFHDLQRDFNQSGSLEGKPMHIHLFKKAIWLAGTAFSETISDPAALEIEEVNHALGYFMSNALAARPKEIDMVAESVTDLPYFI